MKYEVEERRWRGEERKEERERERRERGGAVVTDEVSRVGVTIAEGKAAVGGGRVKLPGAGLFRGLQGFRLLASI